MKRRIDSDRVKVNSKNEVNINNTIIVPPESGKVEIGGNFEVDGNIEGHDIIGDSLTIDGETISNNILTIDLENTHIDDAPVQFDNGETFRKLKQNMGKFVILLNFVPSSITLQPHSYVSVNSLCIIDDEDDSVIYGNIILSETTADYYHAIIRFFPTGMIEIVY